MSAGMIIIILVVFASIVTILILFSNSHGPKPKLKPKPGEVGGSCLDPKVSGGIRQCGNNLRCYKRNNQDPGICVPKVPNDECDPKCGSSQQCLQGICVSKVPNDECNPKCGSTQQCLQGKCVDQVKWKCESKPNDSIPSRSDCSCIRDDTHGTFLTKEKCLDACCYSCDNDNGTCTSGSGGQQSKTSCEKNCIDPSKVTITPDENLIKTASQRISKAGGKGCHGIYDTDCNLFPMPWATEGEDNIVCDSNFCKSLKYVHDCDNKICEKLTDQASCVKEKAKNSYDARCMWNSDKKQCEGKAHDWGICAACTSDKDCGTTEPPKTCLQGKCVDHRKIQACESDDYEDWDFNIGVSLQTQQQCLNKWRTTELENERAKVCSDACKSAGSRPPMCTGSMDDCFKFSRFSSECNAKNGVQGTYHWGCNGT